MLCIESDDMKSNGPALYRLVWRWHFYAGLLVAPFMVILSVSGLIYLFNDELNDYFQRDLRFAAVSSESVGLSRIATSAIESSPGAFVTRIDTPKERGRSAEVFITSATGQPLRVFVDPGTGRVLGTHNYYATLVGIADQVHGSLLLGELGDAIVELAACWGFILIVTGLYLWWPRGQLSVWATLIPRWHLNGRGFWRSVHAATGAWTAILVLFLIVTGLPWASLWGGLFRQVIEKADIGYPTSFRGYGAPTSTSPSIGSETGQAAPWTLAEAPAPRSSGHGAHVGHVQSNAKHGTPIGLDHAAHIVEENGIRPPYRFILPKGERGVFVAFTYPDKPQGQRSLYIDQYTGQVLAQVSYADYGWAARAIELGVQLHMGNYFGGLNQLVMAVPCIGLIMLSVTGPYMWWNRRPPQGFGAPRTPMTVSTGGLAAIVALLAVVFPLAGASLIIVLVGDTVWQRVMPRPESA